MTFGAAVMFLVVTTFMGEDRVDFSHQEFTSLERCIAAGERLKKDWAKEKWSYTQVNISYVCVGQ